MTFTIPLEEVFSRFLVKIEGYDLFDPSISEQTRSDFLCSYARAAISEPFVRRLFSTLWLTEPFFGKDESGSYKVEGLLEFTLERETDEYMDRDFVLEVIAYGMALAWIEPKVQSLINLQQLVGTSNEKFYSQSTHIQQLRGLRNDLEIRRNHLISQRELMYNDYLDGQSSSAFLRKTSAIG